MLRSAGDSHQGLLRPRGFDDNQRGTSWQRVVALVKKKVYLGGGADDHAVIVSDDAVELLHGKLVLHIRLVTPLLEDVHANL